MTNISLFAAGLFGGNSWITIIIMVLLVGVMFFFMFRNQKKQEKEANEMRNNLQIGDEITTIGGIIGEVVRIKDETVTIETGKDRTKIRILRTAIRSVDVHASDKYGTPAPQPQESAKKVKIEKVKAVKKSKKTKEVPVVEVPAEEAVNEATETTEAVANETENN